VVIGIDYGTLSGRAVVVRVRDGQEPGSAVHDYPHAVLDAALPTGESLPPEWALQVPADFIEVLHWPPAARITPSCQQQGPPSTCGTSPR
jgi:L-ribulokinase